MKSYCKSLYNYMADPFESITETITKDEMQDSLDNAIQTSLLQHRVFTEADTVDRKDTVTLSMKSECSRFNREELQLTVGLGLFHKEMEEKLIGHTVGSSFSVTVEEGSVEIFLKQCQRLTVPTLTDEFVKSLQIEGVQNTEEYKAHLRNGYKELYYNGYITWYAMQLFSDTLEKCQWEIDEEEWDCFLHQWSEAQQKEREFHNMDVMEGYEEVEQEDAHLFFRMALIYCLLSGKDHRTFSIAPADPGLLEKIQKAVLAPIEQYLKDKITIAVEEEE